MPPVPAPLSRIMNMTCMCIGWSYGKRIKRLGSKTSVNRRVARCSGRSGDSLCDRYNRRTEEEKIALGHDRRPEQGV